MRYYGGADLVRLMALLASEDVQPVNVWIRQCEVVWIEFDSVANAKEFERQLLNVWMPALSYR